jgi:ribosomal protein S18 acetylase RimI-like enzyme
MSDPRIDELAESARNRGLRLVRSRVRTPGKRRFGKVGLADARGKPVFGMDDKGPIGSPDEIENYLRNLGAKDWGASLDVAVLPRKRKPTRLRDAANDREPAPEATTRPVKPKPRPRPKPEPVLQIREARPADAPRLVELMKLLDHDVDAKGVRKRITALARQKLPQLVATLDKKIVGLAGIDSMTAIHRDQPVGRITILVIAKEARNRGIGRLLTEAAEQALKQLDCGMVEVTSNDRLAAAHAFYRHMGYERTSIRFMKKL